MESYFRSGKPLTGRELPAQATERYLLTVLSDICWLSWCVKLTDFKDWKGIFIFTWVLMRAAMGSRRTLPSPIRYWFPSTFQCRRDDDCTATFEFMQWGMKSQNRSLSLEILSEIILIASVCSHVTITLPTHRMQPVVIVSLGKSGALLPWFNDFILLFGPACLWFWMILLAYLPFQVICVVKTSQVVVNLLTARKCSILAEISPSPKFCKGAGPCSEHLLWVYFSHECLGLTSGWWAESHQFPSPAHRYQPPNPADSPTLIILRKSQFVLHKNSWHTNGIKHF